MNSDNIYTNYIHYVSLFPISYYLLCPVLRALNLPSLLVSCLCFTIVYLSDQNIFRNKYFLPNCQVYQIVKFTILTSLPNCQAYQIFRFNILSSLPICQAYLIVRSTKLSSLPNCQVSKLSGLPNWQLYRTVMFTKLSGLPNCQVYYFFLEYQIVKFTNCQS